MRASSMLAIVFLSLVALGHLLRIVLGLDLVIGATHIPMWMSAAACVFTAAVAYMLVRDARAV